MDDVKQGYRDAEDKAKETWRRADGDEDLADKVGNLGDDIRRELGNAGDKVGDAADRMDPRRPQQDDVVADERR